MCELEASRLNDACDDDLFLVVIDEMKVYEELAPCLGITEAEICEIQNDYRGNYKLAKQNFLQLWRKKNGTSATIYALIIAFLKIGDREVAETIVGYIKQIFLSCQQSNLDNVHPEKVAHDQRYRNWEDMSKEERKATKEKLVVENCQVRRKFATCFRRISRSFERRKASVNDLKMTLNLAFKKKLPELVSAANVGEIFVILSEHLSFFNYQLLDTIVDDLGNEEEREILSEYKNDILKPYLQRSIFEVPLDSVATSAHKKSSQTRYYLCLKLVENIDLSGDEIIVIKHNLAKLLQLPSLELAQFDDGSIHLIFSISKEVYDYIPVASPLHKFIVQDKSSYISTADIVLIL